MAVLGSIHEQRGRQSRARGPRMSLMEWANLPQSERGELVDGYLMEEEVPEYVHES